ncbi:hypothetical protein J2T02_005560 [Chitinophaga terrae (ex Kim and Jung 2007)]|uniref:carboxypeptidase-like regulatory domain-containing protein n=1 Tax=Chitinophaga terrae (ex Kim and Jung 2007) TaxID=408074 RepID=UPI0027862BA7|nr:carboxypeptidase-like regulatory domain-containing protein [Chitinophaga terrae (ex Kim and Jung 2007)]MDQ0110410.1 hypothetical protein [Chitinophaga terrae (ex Kim and Jung 2007)]
MKANVIIYLWALLALGLSACSKKDKENEPQSQDNGAKGKISGVIYAPNGAEPLPAARISTEVEGTQYATATDKAGKFELEVPAGKIDLTIALGDNDRFISKQQVTVQPNQTTTLSKVNSTLTYTGKIAYLRGLYDKAEEFVKGPLGLEATEVKMTDLLDYNKIKEYDVLILNCGSLPPIFHDFEKLDATLNTFLQNGGSIYASDWAMGFLVGGEKTTPGGSCNGVEHEGGFIPEDLLCTVYQDRWQSDATGIIQYLPFQLATGLEKVDIHFAMGSWTGIQSYPQQDKRFEVWINDAELGPLVMKIAWGKPKVFPDGHKRGGTIIFTAFHAHVGDDAASPEIVAILKQILLNL